MPFGCGVRAEAQSILLGEGGGFPQVWVVVSLVNLNLPVVRPNTESASIMQ